MASLSVFIDESGDFGEVKNLPANYIVTMVFHNQETDINEDIKKLETSVRDAGFQLDYIHTGPIIRREDVFEGYSIDDRRKLIYKILNFYNKCDIRHVSVSIDRKEAENKVVLSGRLSRKITEILDERAEFFHSFDQIIVYYDNGQTELSAILNAVFSACYANVEFRKAEPVKYRLLQVADFICSMELLRIKKEEKRLSKSEEAFFYKPQELKKTFLKSVDKKRL